MDIEPWLLMQGQIVCDTLVQSRLDVFANIFMFTTEDCDSSTGQKSCSCPPVLFSFYHLTLSSKVPYE